MSRPPNIKVPGRGKGRNIPPGYIIGRVSHGRGPLELIAPGNFGRLGLSSANAAAQKAAQAGFQFFAGGLLKAGELLGSGTWAHAQGFQNGIDGSSITSLTPAAVTAVFRIVAVVLGVPTDFGTITFAAGSTTGVLLFTVSPFTIPAGSPVQLYAPASADATLSSVTGVVMGYAA